MILKTQNEIVVCAIYTHRTSADESTHDHDRREANHRSRRVGLSPHEAPSWERQSGDGRRLRGLRLTETGEPQDLGAMWAYVRQRHGREGMDMARGLVAHG